MDRGGQQGTVAWYHAPVILYELLDLYSVVVVIAVVASWLQLPASNPIGRIVYGLTEPLLQPIRRVLPPMGGLDFSPLVLLVLVQVLKRMVLF
jgi:YggT family protein